MLCILWLDQPIALFFSTHDSLRPLFQASAVPSVLALPAAGLFLLWALAQKLRGISRVNPLALRVSLAILAATAAKDELKWLFGRTWPGSWLKYGMYSFHPLTDSPLCGGFPSGHTAYISAPLGVLWVLRPRWRPAYAALILAVMTGLVGADYHFVSDVLAGLITGTASAWGTLVLLGREERRA
ncbi:MAG: phosphatase PAP2 family protein [Acidocella sp.]|nr:phosphatase PAP2 family protein [Acidocella sp.]MDR3717614.1 phosphatase PAP2 family protein [Bryobacteraceae bacterium]